MSSWMFGSDHVFFFSWVFSVGEPAVHLPGCIFEPTKKHSTQNQLGRFTVGVYHRITAVLIRGDGFVGNRMLAPYAGEAKMVAEEGATIEQIDKAWCGYIRLSTWDVYIKPVVNHGIFTISNGAFAGFLEPSTVAFRVSRFRLNL